MTINSKISFITEIKPENLHLYHYTEMISVFEYAPSKKNLNLRKADYILACTKKEELFLKNGSFDEIKNTYHLKKVRTIKGIVANQGQVTGIAYVLHANFKNFDTLTKIVKEMKNGTILVTETTSPDLIIACKKASAIITNQGGLGSHAAIVSRELNIPCIVGTQDATKLIKTGDTLIVDAIAGIVQIVSKK